MSNDLISREKLIDSLNLCGCYKHENPKAYDTLMLYEILEAIEDQPTAYDVDKVADGVNEALDRLFNFCEEIDLHIPEDERTGYKMLNDIWAIRDIVKRGDNE